jgi:hypothetical protein
MVVLIATLTGISDISARTSSAVTFAVNMALRYRRVGPWRSPS